MIAGHGEANPRLDTLDPGLEVNSAINGYLVGTQQVYHTAYGWFVAAAIFVVVCIALIAPT